MTPPDARAGWDELDNAEQYDEFARTYPFYTESGQTLVSSLDLSDAAVVVDLCGGTGVTASAVLSVLPANGYVVTIDSSAVMQAVGRRARTDPRITWTNATAERAAEHIDALVDAVVCNAGIWKTDVPAAFAAVKRLLRPGGRLAFNVGGGFAGLAAAVGQPRSPTLSRLITDIAVREYGYRAVAADSQDRVLSADVISRLLADAGLAMIDSRVVTQRGSLEEKRAWLSIPLFARPPGQLTHDQRLEILDRAFQQVDRTRPVLTQWLVVVAGA